MKIWLVVMATANWSTPYTPLTVKEMPNLASCEAVLATIYEMSGGATKVRCVRAVKDWR